MRFVLYGGLFTALAACSPTPQPLPAGQSAKGERAAAITLAAQAAPLKAKVRATSRAEVQEGGLVELRVYANDRQCIFDQVTRQPPMGPGFNISLYCDVDVPASTPFSFRAEQVGKDAVTREVTIEASYTR